ncbi:MAG: hypothetical protein AAF990_26040 [Bacteroidota bacterium]
MEVAQEFSAFVLQLQKKQCSGVVPNKSAFFISDKMFLLETFKQPLYKNRVYIWPAKIFGH